MALLAISRHRAKESAITLSSWNLICLCPSSPFVCERFSFPMCMWQTSVNHSKMASRHFLEDHHYTTTILNEDVFRLFTPGPFLVALPAA